MASNLRYTQKHFSSPKGSFTSTSPSIGPPLNLVPQPSNLVIMLDFFFSLPYTWSIRVFVALPSKYTQTLTTSRTFTVTLLVRWSYNLLSLQVKGSATDNYVVTTGTNQDSPQQTGTYASPNLGPIYYLHLDNCKNYLSSVLTYVYSLSNSKSDILKMQVESCLSPAHKTSNVFTSH